VDFVSAVSATAAYGLDVTFAFRFPDNDTEVITAPRTGPGEVYSHGFSLALPTGPYNSPSMSPRKEGGRKNVSVGVSGEKHMPALSALFYSGVAVYESLLD
jgi:hypothetical protein